MDGMLKCLEEKKALLEELLAEVRKQADTIAQSDIDGLRQSIGARQAVMDKIDAVDGRIRKGSGLSALSGNARADALLSEIKALLQDIRDRDTENVRNAESVAASFMTGIRETNAEKNLLAYSNAPSSRCRYVNKKG